MYIVNCEDLISTFQVSDMDNENLAELDGALKHVQKAGESTSSITVEVQIC